MPLRRLATESELDSGVSNEDILNVIRQQQAPAPVAAPAPAPNIPANAEPIYEMVGQTEQDMGTPRLSGYRVSTDIGNGLFSNKIYDVSGNYQTTTTSSGKDDRGLPELAQLAGAAFGMGGLGGPLTAVFTEAGMSPVMAKAATSIVGNTVSGMAQGQSFGDALQNAAISTAIQTGSVEAARALVENPAARSALASTIASAVKGGTPEQILQNAAAGFTASTISQLPDIPKDLRGAIAQGVGTAISTGDVGQGLMSGLQTYAGRESAIAKEEADFERKYGPLDEPAAVAPPAEAPVGEPATVAPADQTVPVTGTAEPPPVFDQVAPPAATPTINPVDQAMIDLMASQTPAAPAEVAATPPPDQSIPITGQAEQQPFVFEPQAVVEPQQAAPPVVEPPAPTPVAEPAVAPEPPVAPAPVLPETPPTAEEPQRVEVTASAPPPASLDEQVYQLLSSPPEPAPAPAPAVSDIDQAMIDLVQSQAAAESPPADQIIPVTGAAEQQPFAFDQTAFVDQTQAPAPALAPELATAPATAPAAAVEEPQRVEITQGLPAREEEPVFSDLPESVSPTDQIAATTEDLQRYEATGSLPQTVLTTGGAADEYAYMPSDQGVVAPEDLQRYEATGSLPQTTEITGKAADEYVFGPLDQTIDVTGTKDQRIDVAAKRPDEYVFDPNAADAGMQDIPVEQQAAEQQQPADEQQPAPQIPGQEFLYSYAPRRGTSGILARALQAPGFQTGRSSVGLSAIRPAGEIESEISGKKRRDVWNEASLRLKDALGL